MESHVKVAMKDITNAKNIMKDIEIRNQGKEKGEFDLLRFPFFTGKRWFSVYCVSFEFENGTFITLKVPGKIYKNLRIGDAGVLVHTGTRFRKFHIGKSLADI